MNSRVALSGNSGPKVRSDCEISLTLRDGGGIVIDLNSKVKTLYGSSIVKQCTDSLNFFGISNALLEINDSGALPFVISARLEAAVKKLISTELDDLPDFIERNNYGTTRERFRFSRLYVPGNNPGMMVNAGLHSADGVILDLEDSVAPEKKDEARILVRNALRQIDFYGAERMVRINQGDTGLKDLDYVIPQNVNLILIPKCENPDSVKIVNSRITQILAKMQKPNPVYLMPIIESASGVERAFEIACSSENIVALAIGLEDYATDLGVPRTSEGKESFYARTRLIVAAKAAGIQPVDSVFSDVADMEGLRQNVLASKALGFEGMGCIHPRQVAIINQGFAPDRDEVEKSMKIISAYNEALSKGSGVTALGSKMIDAPVVIRAQRTIALAVKLGLIPDQESPEQIAEQN